MLSLDPADPVSLYSIAWDRHDRNLAHLRHTAWTFKDGAPAEIYSLAQTPDGFLWLGTASGLFRFDGIRFQQYQPPSDPKFNQRKVCSHFSNTRRRPATGEGCQNVRTALRRPCDVYSVYTWEHSTPGN